MPHVIDERMATLIKKATGLTVEEIRTVPLEEVHTAIENKIGHKLYFDFDPESRLINSEKIEKEIDKI